MYEVDTKDIKYNFRLYLFNAIMLAFFLIILVWIIIDYVSNSTCVLCSYIDFSSGFYLAVLLGIGFLVTFIKMLIDFLKVLKKLKMLKRLQKNGRLLKNIPFTVEVKTNVFVTVTFCIVDGVPRTFTREQVYYDKKFDTEQLIDILYDENNLNDYYIDFNINRIGGNLKSDYYMEDNKK